MVTARYLMITARYLMVIARYLMVTAPYRSLLLAPTFSMNDHQADISQ